MKLELEVRNNGNERGTLGWLCKHVSHVDVSVNGSGERGAWLCYRDDKAQTLIALSGSVYLERASEGIDWTDAAWAVVRDIAREVAPLMREDAELAGNVTVTLSR